MVVLPFRVVSYHFIVSGLDGGSLIPCSDISLHFFRTCGGSLIQCHDIYHSIVSDWISMGFTQSVWKL